MRRFVMPTESLAKEIASQYMSYPRLVAFAWHDEFVPELEDDVLEIMEEADQQPGERTILDHAQAYEREQLLAYLRERRRAIV